MIKEPTLEEQELLADTRRRAQAARPRGDLPDRARHQYRVRRRRRAPCSCCRHRRGGTRWPRSSRWRSCASPSESSSRSPSGFTVASQLAFVPMLFSMPMAFVPVAVSAVLAAQLLPDVLAGSLPAPSCSASGQRLVRRRPGARVRGRRRPPRRRRSAAPGRRAGRPVRRRLRRRAVYHAPVTPSRACASSCASAAGCTRSTPALSVVALVVAEELHRAPYAVLAVVPLLGLLRMFANERQRSGWASCSSSTRPTAAPRCCWATSSPPTTTTPASTPRASSGWRWPWATLSASIPSAGATSSSAPCSTTSARSPSPRRSSTSRASSTRTSGRSSRPTRPRASGCSTASAAS